MRAALLLAAPLSAAPLSVTPLSIVPPRSGIKIPSRFENTITVSLSRYLESLHLTTEASETMAPPRASDLKKLQVWTSKYWRPLEAQGAQVYYDEIGGARFS